MHAAIYASDSGNGNPDGDAGVETFRKRWLWPMFSDPKIEAEYNKYKKVSESKTNISSAIVYFMLYLANVTRMFVYFRPTQPIAQLNALFKIGIILGIVSFMFLLDSRCIKRRWNHGSNMSWESVSLPPVSQMLYFC